MLVFATNNQHKIKEVELLLEGKMKVLGLKDINCNEELPETHETLEENSLEKAAYVKEHYGADCFSEDTGLEVFALNNEPGVYSARYAGPQRIDTDNMALLLKNLDGKPDRQARFRTVITLLVGNKQWQFEGICNGTIALQASGNKGFGYDPIFVPDGYTTTFAEMESAEKSKISHRGEAVRKLTNFLKKEPFEIKL